ncbi:MAG: prephenate dehydrogenase, partial [Anaerolineae bacterium]
MRAEQLQDAEVAIVGLGLMGGSLAAALSERRACRRVVGVARREESITHALSLGIIDAGTLDLQAGVRSADIVILATPVRTILQEIREIGPLLPQGCLLTDLGSTKVEIVRAMQALPPHVQPVGGHPMCGKETSGLGAADARLYDGATYLMTPLPRTRPATVALIEELIQSIGAKPYRIDAERHDLLVGAISHLPYVLSAGLVATVDALEDDIAWTIAASGFRDTSRLAASDETMMVDILLTNRASLQELLALLQVQIAQLEGWLAAEDEARLCAALQKTARRRRSL